MTKGVILSKYPAKSPGGHLDQYEMAYKEINETKFTPIERNRSWNCPKIGRN